MADEKRLIDASVLVRDINADPYRTESEKSYDRCLVHRQPTVDAVEVEDKELLKAIKILVEQYGHSKRSVYVHSPVAHALYHTWKKLDGGTS